MLAVDLCGSWALPPYWQAECWCGGRLKAAFPFALIALSALCGVIAYGI